MSLWTAARTLTGSKRRSDILYGVRDEANDTVEELAERGWNDKAGRIAT
jgi:hypothetical protein